MKLSIARVSVSSCRSHTSSRIALRDTGRPDVLDQVLKQVALHLRELIRLLADVQLQRLEVQRLAGKRQLLVLVLILLHPLAAAQQSAQPGQQNLQLERLGQVIVRARLETLQHIGGPAARGQHQHRHVMPGGAQLLRHREAVLARQHHVEHDGVVAVAIGQQPIERLLAVAIDVHRVALGFEIEPQAFGQVRFVFDDQDAAHPSTRRRALASGPLASVRSRSTGPLARGSSSVNVEPLPSPALSANTRPPWRLAIERTM